MANVYLLIKVKLFNFDKASMNFKYVSKKLDSNFDIGPIYGYFDSFTTIEPQITWKLIFLEKLSFHVNKKTIKASKTTQGSHICICVLTKNTSICFWNF